MAADSTNPVSGEELGNGPCEPLAISVKLNGTSNGNLGVKELSASLEDAVKLGDHSLSYDKEILEEPALQPECHSIVTVEALEVKESSDSKNSKPQKGMGKARNGKSSSPRQVAPAALSKIKDGKNVPKSSVASNGTISSESVRVKTYALKTKGKSFNERQAADSSKATFVQTVPKQHQNPDATSSSTSEAPPEDLTEVTKPKVVKKGPAASKAEETSQSSPQSPGSEDARARKLGTLPAYNFNFKCDERAEKRREFYTKLEEKIHAKEQEKNNMQAKTKETQDAEIKMLRKSLGFKATPMPSFYQEPAPPKVELKKIPTTRAKSPKLGRKKNSSEENDAPIARPSRLSLDEKLSKGNVAKTPPPVVHVKKPLRKSLPRLPSENTSISGEKKKAISHKNTASKEAEESGHEQNDVSKETSEAAGTHKVENEGGVEGQEQTSLVQDGIAV
ncbi:hypothetical protein C2S52_002899 [Perilla frutescens var. hirtella]|nr:hypothetical protein C2S51_012554 [Perilla frutescens var. frutescens]KAH6792422.1 hypothetical protein C2S52_002899 [Perilla frutescens var. hirtella]